LSPTLRFVLSIAVLAAATTGAPAQDPEPSRIPDLPAVQGVAHEGVEGLSGPLQIVLVLTVLALAPAILMTATSFTRILIVLSFIRRALSVPELPPNQILVGLSLFLTLLVMRPVMTEINDQALQPYLAKKVTIAEAGKTGGEILGKFLMRHTRDEDVRLFVDLASEELPAGPENVPLTILIPAFALSELRTAFQMGFLVYLPFLILDLVISSVLLSMGMFMLPPVIISTPFKILLFVLVDGWDLVVKSLVESFHI
jgi:flagellar biosynthetic protein FliP